MRLTDAEYARLRSELGEIDRADLDARYERLRSLEAVALEVLRERRAALVADPLAVTIQGVATVNNSDNVKALERQISDLERRYQGASAYIYPAPLRPRRLR